MGDSGFIGKPSRAAGGWGALKSCGKQLLASGAPLTGARTMLKANQPDGFDCPGCAWGDPEHGSSFEFCENGLKAVAWEATGKRNTPKFFIHNSVSRLRTWSDHALELVGRLTHPLRYDPASDRYLAVSWESAFREIGEVLRSLDDPHRAEFYTSGRTSNEAAFLYQLFVRMYGTNNLPDCSNMCHEASGVGLRQSIGVGKGTVKLEDFELADAIFVIGQNPGTNHPRMLADLRKAAGRGARVLAFNPIRERGLERFADPQDKVEMLRGGSGQVSTHYYQPRLGGDMAWVRGVAKAVFAADDAALAAGGRSLLDREFLATHTQQLDAWRAAVDATGWEQIEDQSGLARADIEEVAGIYLASQRVICTWAMGITQHHHSVATIREITNLMLLRGNVGKPGAGLCPVRGHSNVQGDRTVGINEKAPPDFLDALEREFGIRLRSREHGHNVLGTIGALLDGSAQAFIGLGGNFARATPDSALVAGAMPRLRLTVHVATKLNHSHLMPGAVSYILPCLGRTEVDVNAQGVAQLVSVEDSMSMVHGSAGINPPASPELRSEVAIVAGIAAATLGTGQVDWLHLAEDYDRIRARIEAVIPGFEDFNRRLREPRGFYLPNAAAARQWNTTTGKAMFHSDTLPGQTGFQRARDGGSGFFVLQSLRSHDQYNTTVYGMDDRYRGVYGERKVVFINPHDLAELGAAAGDLVDIDGVYDDGVKRRVDAFRFVPYDIPRNCIAGYYPELNMLVPSTSTGELSDTPTSKSVLVKLTPRRREAA